MLVIVFSLSVYLNVWGHGFELATQFLDVFNRKMVQIQNGFSLQKLSVRYVFVSHNLPQKKGWRMNERLRQDYFSINLLAYPALEILHPLPAHHIICIMDRL
jgi:hypothetical protein